MQIEVATTATIQAILDKLYAAAGRNAGVGQFTLDGLFIRFNNPKELTDAIDYWERRLAEATDGGRPRTLSVDFRGAW